MEDDIERPEWWRVVCLLRAAAPAPQVIAALRERPCSWEGPSPGCALQGPGLDALPPRDPLDEHSQRTFLHLLDTDPVLVACSTSYSSSSSSGAASGCSGGRTAAAWAYRRSLLKRLVAEVEQRARELADEKVAPGKAAAAATAGGGGGAGATGAEGLSGGTQPGARVSSSGGGGGGGGEGEEEGVGDDDAVSLSLADEVAEAYAEALMAEAPPPAKGDQASGAGQGWLLKTFAYGPTQGQGQEQEQLQERGACHATEETPPTSAGVSGSGDRDECNRGAACGAVLPPPLPPHVSRRHAARLAAALRGMAADAAAEAIPAAGDTCHGDMDAGEEAGGHPRCADGEAADGAEDGADEGAGGEAVCGLVTLRVSPNMLAGSTGCHEWEAGFALAELVLCRPQLFRGRRVLELGCGAGLVGVALQRVGAQLAALTDGSAAAVHNCAANLRLNGIGGAAVVVQSGGGGGGGVAGYGAAGGGGQQQPQLVLLEDAGQLAEVEQGVACCELAWEAPPPPSALRCDVVVASDVLYDPVVVPVLVGLLVKLLGRAPAPAGAAGDEAQAAAADAADAAAGERSTTEAFIASTLRNPQTMELFLRTAAGSGLRVEDVGTGDGGEEGPGAGAGAGSRRVRFHHVPGLELAEKRILIHRVTMGL